MIRMIITPQEQHISINIPKEFVGKQVEILVYATDEIHEALGTRDVVNTHFASEKVLAKDWLRPEEDEAWQGL